MIDLSEVQSTVVRPSGAPTVDLLFVSLPSAAAMREFVAAAAETVTTAAAAAERHETEEGDDRFRAVNVGLTPEGIRLLELPERTYVALPTTFTSGMRAAAPRLGDVGPSAPSAWQAPFDGATTVHAVVLRHGGAPLGALEAHSTRVVATWGGGRLPGGREPFGFRDDISDPVIEGSGKLLTPGNGVWDDGRWRPVAAGEAVLGHVDESDTVAGHPDAAHVEGNGSYLVIRKLEQDVGAFWDACAAWASEIGGGTTADDVAAQLVGRRRDGTVLGRCPGGSLNDFRYGGTSGVGRDVPPSAHIRRSNPRDDPVVPAPLVRRHLLFRRGYPYHDATGRGLLFMACCADLRRQFEFVQARWMQDGTAFDLGAERDPLVGQRGGRAGPADLVSINGPGRKRTRRSLPSFVTTRGGEYVLLPGRSALELLGGVTR